MILRTKEFPFFVKVVGFLGELPWRRKKLIQSLHDTKSDSTNLHFQNTLGRHSLRQERLSKSLHFRRSSNRQK